MTVNEWVKLIQRQGGVCNDYMRKLKAVSNKTEMFRVLCDVNGGAWLFDLHARGVQIPIDSFLNEFANYINGKKVVDYPSGYTSKFYCRQEGGEIIADTTLIYVLECICNDIFVPENKYPTIILSDKCTYIDIHICKGAKANIESYGNAEYHVHSFEGGDISKVRITKH